MQFLKIFQLQQSQISRLDILDTSLGCDMEDDKHQQNFVAKSQPFAREEKERRSKVWEIDIEKQCSTEDVTISNK